MISNGMQTSITYGVESCWRAVHVFGGLELSRHLSAEDQTDGEASLAEVGRIHHECQGFARYPGIFAREHSGT